MMPRGSRTVHLRAVALPSRKASGGGEAATGQKQVYVCLCVCVSVCLCVCVYVCLCVCVSVCL